MADVPQPIGPLAADVPTAAPRARTLAAGLAIFLITIAAYVPAFQAGFIWDDDVYVTKNPTLGRADGLARIWSVRGGPPQFYPLVFTSFWIEHQLWGLRPVGYHAVNILLHAAGAVLLWRLLKCLSVPGAWVAAAVFALHPVHVESVAWITERKNVLSGVFYLAAALAYLHYHSRAGKKAVRPYQSRDREGAVRSVGDETAPSRSRLCYGTTLLLFACALLSKTVTCTLPAALALLIWWKHGRLTRRDIAPLLPLVLLGAVLGLNTAWMERHVVGAEGQDWHMSFTEHCLVAGRVLWFYAGKLIWPAGLAFNYPRWIVDSAQPWQYAFPLAAVALPIALWLWRGRLGRGPLAAVLFFGGTLVPAMGFTNLYPMRYSFVADHFQYLASIGIIVLVVGLLARCVAAARNGWQVRGMAALLTAVVLACYGGLTWRQCGAYANAESIWRDALAKYPDATLARLNLATIYQARGDLAGAIEELKAVLRMEPKVHPPTVRMGAYLDLGIAYNRLGEFEAAAEQFRNALQIQPNCGEAHHGLGMAYESLGRLDDAIAEYRLAVKHDPDYRPAQRRLDAALSKRGRQSPPEGHGGGRRLP